MNGFWFGAGAAASLAAALPAAAQQAQQPQTQPTVEQQYDAATRALREDRWEDALRQYEAIEARVGHANAQSLAVIRIRKGEALLALGRLDEAVEALRLGLGALPAADRSLDSERFTATLTLGRAAEQAFDYRAATAHFRAAAAIDVSPARRLAAYRGLIQTQIFFDAEAALRDADEGIRLARLATPGEEQVEGSYRTLRSRVLLNMGRFAEARQELETATRQVGGLMRTRIERRDIIARSDLSLAAALAGDQEGARLALALTGAGRIRGAFPPVDGRLAPPRCGNGLDPGDVGVVEFSIRDNGTVGHSTPIYSSKSGEAALTFGRAVSRWWWPPDEIRQIQPVFRSAIRVELRCTQRPLESWELPADEAAAVARWSAAHGVPLETDVSRVWSAAQLQADLAALEARHGRAAPQLIVPLMRLGRASELRPRDRVPFLERALSIAAVAAVPDPYLSLIAFRLHSVRREAEERDSDVPDFQRILAEPAVRGNSYVAADVHLTTAQSLAYHGRAAAAAEALQRAFAVNLPADHPLVAGMLELTAVMHAARGDHGAAEAAWQRIPAAARRCIMPPRRGTASVGSSDFPMAAMRWGFEGWAIVESLVGRSGATSVRTTVAYPPLVFSRGAEDIARRFRFEPTFEPPSGPCAVHRQSFQFRLE